MNKIYKVVWNAARNCYVVGSEFISKTRRGEGYRSNVTTAGARTLLAVCAACGISFYSGGLAVAADNLQTEPTIVIEVQEQKNEAVQPELLYSQLAAASAGADALDITMPADVPAAAEDTSEAPAVDVTSQHSIHDENGYYVYNGTENDTYNSLTKDGLWVGGVDDKTGFHVDNTGHASAYGLDVQNQKITGVDDGTSDSDAATYGQVKDVDAKIGDLDFSDTHSLKKAENVTDALTKLDTKAYNLSGKIDDFSRSGIMAGGTLDTRNAGTNSIQLGNQARAAGQNSIAFGAGASVTGENTEESILTRAKNNGVAIGYSATAAGFNTTVLGAAAKAQGDNATALGQGTLVTADNSVALGAGSRVTTDDIRDSDTNGVVSVGKSDGERRIINVADGVNDSDAATVGQISKITGMDSEKGNVVQYDGEDKATINFAGTNGTALNNVNDIVMNVKNPINKKTEQHSFQNAGLLPGKVEGKATSGKWNMAIGEGSEVAVDGGTGADMQFNTAIGNSAGVSQNIVDGNYVDVERSTAIGHAAKVSASNSTAIGDSSNVSKDNSVAVGQKAEVQSATSIAIGQGTKIGGNAENSIAIGTSANQYSVGSKAKNSTVVGVNAWSMAEGGTVLGKSAKIQGSAANGTAIGTNATINVSAGSGNVALGADSTVSKADVGDDTEHGVVSVGQSGDKGFNRRIINVADGVNDSDAATVKQVKAVQGDVDELNKLAVTYTDDTKKAVNFNGATLKKVGDIQIGNAQSTFVGSGLVNGKVYDTDAGQWAENGANATHSMAVGSKSSVRGTASVAVGPEAAVNNGNAGVLEQSTAVGSKATVSSSFSTALGANTQAKGDYSVAVGAQSQTTGANATAIGAYAAAGENSVVVGGGEGLAAPTVSKANSTAMGTYVDIKSDNGTALGYGSQVGGNGRNSVALGADSVANEENVVSVGHTKGQANGFGETYGEDLNRRITNVADGKNANDAATVGQISKITGMDSEKGNVVQYDGEDKSVVTFAGENGTKLTNLAAGEFKADSTDAVTAGQLYAAGIVPGTISSDKYTTNGAIALGENALVSGERNGVDGSIAIGDEATVDNTTMAVALGSGSTVSAAHSIALGANSTATASFSTAVGPASTASGGSSTAVGYDSTASGMNSAAFGYGSEASGMRSTALGHNSSASGMNSVALGYNSTADEANVVSVGNDKIQRKVINVADGTIAANSHDAVTGGQLYATNQSVEDNADKLAAYKASGVQAGTVADVNKMGSIALGEGSTVKGNYSLDEEKGYATAIGGQSVAGMNAATAVGGKSLADQAGAIAVGYNSQALENNAISIGLNSKTEKLSDIAIGPDSRAAGGYAVALGKGSEATGYSSVALGHNSVASGQNTVSVGNDDLKRRIINVADGINDSDAATFGQVKDVQDSVKALDASAVQYDSVSKSTVTFDGPNGTALKNVSDIVMNTKDSYGKNAQFSFQDAGLLPGDVQSLGNKWNMAIGEGSAVKVEEDTTGSKMQMNTVIGNTARITQALVDGEYQDVEKSTALGQGVTVAASNAVGVGQGSNVRGEGGVAVGMQANVSAKSGVAVGKQSKVSSDYSIAIGSAASVGSKSENSVAMGYDAGSLAAGGTAIGQGAKVQGSAANGTAIGKGAIVNVNAGNSVALGASSQVQTADIGSDTEYGVVSVGKSGTNGFTRRIVNVADGLNDSDAATVGQLNAVQSAYTNSGIVGGSMDNDTLATGAVAIGKDSKVHGTGSVAIGTGSKVEKHNSVAIGRNAIVKGKGSVALGAGSVATEDNVLSLGRDNGSLGLRIVNMKDGINDRDAVTVGQMNELALGDRKGSLSLDNGATSLAGGINMNTAAINSIDNQLKEVSNVGETNSQSLNDLTEKASAFAAQTQNVDWNALNSVDWNAVNAMAAVPATMNLAVDDVQANEGDTGAEKDDDDRSPQTNGSNPGEVDGNLHVSGNTTLDGTLNVKGDATFEGNATFDKGATMKGDLNMSGNKITGLGAGDVSADSTDAVNGSQLFDVQQQVSDNRNAIGALGSRVSDLGEEVDSVGAISAALAGLHPLDYNGTGSKFQISAALGTYDGTQAAAIGGFYHFNRDTLLSIGGSTSFEGDRKTAANVGVTFRVGEGASEAPAVQDNETKQQMEAMKQEIEMLKAELEQLKNKDTEGTNDKN